MRFTIHGSVPSWKNNRRIVTNPANGKRRMIKSDVCERWLRDAVFELASQRNRYAREGATFPIDGWLDVEVWFFYKGKRRPDLDNSLGAPLDALQAAGIIRNDSQVVRVTAEVWWQTGDESYCTVEIRPTGRGDENG